MYLTSLSIGREFFYRMKNWDHKRSPARRSDLLLEMHTLMGKFDTLYKDTVYLYNLITSYH